MDLVVNPTRENSQRVHRALSSLNVLQGHNADSFTKAGVQAPLKRPHNADVLTPARNGPTYAEISEATVPAKLFSIPIRLPTVDMLIRLKECAIESLTKERDKHAADVECLRRGPR
jgi:hypothetical protein